jgi:hypothetical protein
MELIWCSIKRINPLRIKRMSYGQLLQKLLKTTNSYAKTTLVMSMILIKIITHLKFNIEKENSLDSKMIQSPKKWLLSRSTSLKKWLVNKEFMKRRWTCLRVPLRNGKSWMTEHSIEIKSSKSKQLLELHFPMNLSNIRRNTLSPCNSL